MGDSVSSSEKTDQVLDTDVLDMVHTTDIDMSESSLPSTHPSGQVGKLATRPGSGVTMTSQNMSLLPTVKNLIVNSTYSVCSESAKTFARQVSLNCHLATHERVDNLNCKD